MDRQPELSELIARHFGTDDPLPVGWAELRAELEAVFEERDRLRRTVDEFEARAVESEKNEARLLDAIHVARIGYFEHDHLTGSIYWSPELLELWKWDREVPLQLPEVVQILHPDDRERVLEAIERAHDPSGTGIYEIEHRYLLADGEVCWVRAGSRTFFEGQGEGRQPARTVGAIIDFTKQKLAEIELERARDEMEDRIKERTRELEMATQVAEAANEAKSRFLAVTTHELRTPLNGVIGMLHLLPRDPLSSKQRDWIRMAHASAETLLRVINDILDFSKVEAGKLELHSEDFDLVESVKSLGALYGERAEAAGLAWSLEIDPSVTRRIRGDRGRVAQVLGNLLNNAIKFTERGAICLDVRQMESGDDVSKVRFEVADTGIGINPAFHAQLFKPFSQVDASMAREHSGTGLGLGICKSLVELMGGRIGFESAAGNGSLFWFEIPFDRAGADQPDIGSVRNGGRHSARIHGRVLIVEDSDTNREVLYEVVSAAGCDCDMVSNGAEAVDAVRKAAYHVVLMDCMMPVLDGFEATRQIRELEAAGALASSGRLPIVAVTANAMKGDRERCLAVGMDDFIAKPFDPERVLRVIRASVERGDAGRVA